MLQIDAMAYSDHMIFEALQKVLPDNPKPTNEAIVSHLPIKCERTTVWRALKRLESNGLIQLAGTARNRTIKLVEKAGV